MSSEFAWEKFNELMNSLREEIARRGKELIPIVYASYYFLYEDRFPLSGPGIHAVECRGIKYDDGGISIIIHEPIEGVRDIELQDTGLCILDLIKILEILEK